MLCIWATSDTVYSSGVCLSHLSHVLRGCLRFPWRTSSGPVSFSRCCRSWWCWDTLHLSPSSSGRERERERNTFEIFTELSVKSQAVYFLLTHLSHLLVVVVSEVQIICWIDFILTAVAAWKKWWKHLSVILWCSYVIQLLRSWGSSCEMNSCVSPRLDKTNVKFGWRLIPQRDEQTVWLMRSWNPSKPIKHQKIQTRFPSWRCDTNIGSEARFRTLNQFLS